MSALELPKSSFIKNKRRQKGDILIEALVSTVVLGVMVAGITQSSRIMLGEQRDALTQELLLSQARNQIANFDANGFDECQKQLKPITGGEDGEKTAITLECTAPVVTATVGGLALTDVAIPRTAQINAIELDHRLSVELQMSEQ